MPNTDFFELPGFDDAAGGDAGALGGAAGAPLPGMIDFFELPAAAFGAAGGAAGALLGSDGAPLPGMIDFFEAPGLDDCAGGAAGAGLDAPLTDPPDFWPLTDP